VDSLLKLTDAAGKLLAANDDYDDKGAGLTTHQADSRLIFKLPADGTYLLHIGDTQHKGGPAYAYRLRVSPARPDFELRVMPSSLNAPPGTTVAISVHACRKDGFDGDIALKLKDNAPGFALSGGWIPAGQDRVQMTLTVPRSSRGRPIKLRLEGSATIDGKTVSHLAVPADDVMQAFLYRHLVPAEVWMVSVAGRGGRGGVRLKLLGSPPVKIPASGTAQIRISAPKGVPPEEIRLKVTEPAKGIAVKKVSADRGGLAVLLTIEPEAIKAGLKGNLIAEATREQVLKNKDGKPTGRKRRTLLGTVPAIPFEVVAVADGGAKKP
jgi:hypothetical protein